MKKKKSISKSNVNLTRRKKLEKLHYIIFIGFLASILVYYMFLEYKTVGNDSRYDIYIFWIPTLFGFIFSSKYYIFKEIWDDLLIDFKKVKFHVFAYNTIFTFLGNFVFAYIIIGFPVNVIWNYINKYESEKNNVETYYCDVDRFFDVRGSRIDFKFKNHSETLNVTHQTIKPYLNQDSDDYQLVLEVKEGIWNYYTIENWNIIKKK